MPCGQLRVKQPCIPGWVFAPRTLRGRSTRVKGSRKEPEAGQGLGRKWRRQCSLRYQTFEGQSSLCCKACQGDFQQAAASPWQQATFKGGDRSWRGAPWSATSHNFPWRIPWVCCLSQTKMSMGAPITSDLFSQKYGWIHSVPSVLSHWPSRPPICLQAVRQLAGVRGTLCDHRMHNIDCLQWEDPGAFTSLALGSQASVHSELGLCKQQPP